MADCVGRIPGLVNWPRSSGPPRFGPGILVAALLVTSASAQTDHLECFKVKDSAHKAVYTTRVEGMAAGQGCVVSVPAKLMCEPTGLPTLSPSPPGAAPGGSVGAFLCYKVRCPRNAVTSVSVVDEFGQRLVTRRRSRLLCAPVAASTGGTQATTTTLPGSPTTSTTITPHRHPTTSTTSSTTTSTAHRTTSSTGSTTTTLPGAACFEANTSCGSCGNGACQPLHPSGQLICAYQTQAFCQGPCQSSVDCPAGRFCVGSSGNTGICCSPCS